MDSKNSEHRKKLVVQFFNTILNTYLLQWGTPDVDVNHQKYGVIFSDRETTLLRRFTRGYRIENNRTTYFDEKFC